MNRLPSALPTRWLDQLLPATPHAQPGQRPAWRIPGTAPARPAAPRTAGVPGRPLQPPRQDGTIGRPGLSELPAAEHERWRAGQETGAGEQGDEPAEHGEGDAAASGSVPKSPDTCDAQEIAALLPSGDCSGIFEVHLPGGQMMGVAVDSGPASVAYHLKPAGKALADRLRSQQRELKPRLERRIGKDVTLTIL